MQVSFQGKYPERMDTVVQSGILEEGLTDQGDDQGSK